MLRSKSLTRTPANGPLLVAFIALLLFLTGLYGSALRFGLIWDDPEWYMRVVGKSIFDLMQPSTEFQFYRPGIMIYNRLFIKADKTIAVYVLHWAQIGWYLLNLALIFAISRKVGFPRWAAFMVVVLSALHPFVYQSVAWAAPGQPLAAVFLNTAWVLYLAGRRRGTVPPRKRFIFLSALCFLLAMSINETAVPFAIIPLLLEIAVRIQQHDWRDIITSWRHPQQNGWISASVYLIMACIFIGVWLIVPREGGITGLFVDGRVYAYLLQGFVFAFASSKLSAWAANEWGLVAVWSAVTAALWLIAMTRKRGTLAAVGVVWAVVGIGPSLIGLPFSYVSIASRLFYTAIPGIAWLWVAAFWPTSAKRGSVSTIVGIAILVGMALFGLTVTLNSQRLYTKGISHLTEMGEALMGKNGAYLFINFPDRFRFKEEPLAVGYWGITLAPVVMDLAEFPAMTHGSDAHTISRSMPWLDEESRHAGPYEVDMRGIIIQPDELYRIAETQDGVYVSRYDAEGNFDLQYAGALLEGEGGVCETAVFDKSICLQDAQFIPEGDELIVRTSWWTNTPLPPHLTLFAHLGQPDAPPLYQVDGNSWQKTLPLANWQPGDLIVDERRMPMPPDLDKFHISLGIYNWVSGERLAGVDAGERPLPYNAYTTQIEK